MRTFLVREKNVKSSALLQDGERVLAAQESHLSVLSRSDLLR